MKKPLLVVEEVFRICENGAKVTIAVPYFRSWYVTIDPTHCNFFGVNWFNYFDSTHEFCQKYRYSKACFIVKKINSIGNGKEKMSFIHKLLVQFAEMYPSRYEARLSHIFPLNSLTFHLEVTK